LTESDFDLAWFISLSSEHLCIFDLHGAIYSLKIFVTFFIYIELSLVVVFAVVGIVCGWAC